MTMTYYRTLLGALALLSSACGPEAATTTDSTTDTTSPTTGPVDTSTGGAPTTSGTTGVDTTGVDTTGDTTTGGECLEFHTNVWPDTEAVVQFTCGLDADLCHSDAALFKFEAGPEWDDTATTDDLARVHCVLEALRDRQPGQLDYALFWPVLGPDTGSLEIVGDFVISRRETINDFNYDYWEAALVLEPSQVFADCRAANTAAAAWQCLRPYINIDIEEHKAQECVTAPLVCEGA
ncbi:hypothetical protein [Nannocystis sp. SCPEA4]|uniref:hypothetical protein n=1 Tax=Nannocystis sp. SCPEA4 TaxID=2996787 RepID=UPI002271CD2A|nr:hypothetical protein [Nannocystis sp. SCPEA4]MCY1061289.1 hypothetical protein [Nannocystis sp. SCPEA4]